jgi:hypothetical protein
MHQIRYGAGIEAETLLRDHGNETGTGFEIRIIELAIALVLLKMGGIFWRQKRTLVMIKPPGDLPGAGIFEIDDCILIAVKLCFIEQRTGAVQ